MKKRTAPINERGPNLSKDGDTQYMCMHVHGQAPDIWNHPKDRTKVQIKIILRPYNY